MATKWTRVYVAGKGYRYTDGKGNYKTSNPNLRNPANDVVDAGVRTSRAAASSAGSAATRSASAVGAAAQRTQEREELAKARGGIGYTGRKERERANNPKNGDTKTKEGQKFVFRDGKWVQASNAKPSTGSNQYNAARNRQIEAERERLKGVGNPPAKPAPKPSQATPSQQTRTSTSNNTVSRATTGKPAAKPAGKVPSSNAGMKNQDKNFRGNPDRKDSIASTLRELRGMGSGRKVEGVGPVASGSDYAKGLASSKSSKPEDKSNYVASNGKPYAGPAFGNSKPSAAKKEDKKMTLAEQIRKRRTGMA